MNPPSPLRYPGGKGCLSGLLTDVIDLNCLRGGYYYEPYAGGAGAALQLLQDGVVSEIFINDADVRVAAFWESVLEDTNRFVDEILSIPLSITEWRKQYEICSRPSSYTRFQAGFAAFYMNRCNRSGVLTGAGPIGGQKQSGKWKLGVRFNRERLAERILTVGRLKERIHASNTDALEFLKFHVTRKIRCRKTIVYLDPPYVNKGKRLYLNSYDASDHVNLAEFLYKRSKLAWIMSYDDTDLVRGLYSRFQLGILPIRYSLQEKRNARELIISPHHILLPKSKILLEDSQNAKL